MLIAGLRDLVSRAAAKYDIGNRSARIGRTVMGAISIGNNDHWSFVGGTWDEDESGIMSPPAQRADDHLAFKIDQAYTDVQIDFEFRWSINHCGAGVVLRAQDASHHYLVHFPCCGQHYRAKHFWAAISKMDDRGWLEILKMEMIHGVPSERGGMQSIKGTLWQQVRVVAKGDQISVWVNGRPGPVVHDETYQRGCVGLESWVCSGLTSWAYDGAGSDFRNVRIEGSEAGAASWDTSIEPPVNHFVPHAAAPGQSQGVAGLAHAPNGDLLMVLDEVGLLRSVDRGRTWQPANAEGWQDGTLVDSRDQRILAQHNIDGATALSTSLDNGHTWSVPQKVTQAPFEPGRPMTLHPMSGMVELADGTLLAFHAANDPSWQIAKTIEQGDNVYEWGGLHCTGWSTRSTDGGSTWSAPVPLDGPPAVGINFDMCEFTSTIQRRDGQVLCLGRPIYSPWIWEVWSENQGESWGPSTRGPFCSYACAALPHPTASGALIVGGRMPGLSIYVSHDEGMTWKIFRLGTSTGAMGAMVEVEPDVVLWVYGDNRDTSARGQFIRITADGAEPARDWLPA
jgi:hypothetical protein